MQLYTTTTDQIGAAHHDTEINATCVRGHYFLYKHSHHASCSDCCTVLCCLHLGGDDGGCSCMLLLHPVPTSADAGPDLCTLHPDLCTLHPDLCTLCLWCFPWCNNPRVQVVVATSCMLCWWCFSTVQRLHLHSWWYTSHSGTCI